MPLSSQRTQKSKEPASLRSKHSPWTVKGGAGCPPHKPADEINQTKSIGGRIAGVRFQTCSVRKSANNSSVGEGGGRDNGGTK